MLKHLSGIDATAYLAGVQSKVDKYKPFLGDEVFLLFSAYAGFIGRTVYQFIEGYKSDTLRSWKVDVATVGILKPVIDKKDLQELMSKKIYAFNLVLYYLEDKIIKEIRANLYGKNLSKDTIEYLSGIESILNSQKDRQV